MDAKILALLGCFLLSALSPALCEDGTCAFAAKGQSSEATTEQPDPYKDVTWSSVNQKNQSQNQNQTVTVYTPKGTGQADFVSVTSTGAGNPANVIVATPQGKRSKRWFFW